MTDLETLETLDIPDSSLEPVRRSRIRPQFPFPAVSVWQTALSLNVAASALFKLGDRLRLFTTPDYFVIARATPETYTHKIASHGNAFFIAAKPIIREQNLRPGVYRLYKCRQGYAIKRNEPLEVY